MNWQSSFENNPKPKNADSRRPLNAQEKQYIRILIFIFMLFTAIAAASGYFTYQNYSAQFRKQVESEISAIAELKVNELVDWRKERLADGEVLRKNPLLAALVKRFFEDPSDREARTQLQAWLTSYRTYSDYDRVRLMDIKGNTYVSDPAGLPSVSSEIIKQIPEVLKSGQVTMVDFYRSADQNIYLGMIIPIVDENAGGQIVGLISLSIDPQPYLYPFIQGWPVLSTSAETLIIRRDGNSALFLNPLRFQDDAALNMRLSLDQTQRPSVKAVLGEEGIVEGLDYRNEEVIADIRKIPESPWFLVSKMDTAEVFAPLRERLWMTVFFFGTLVMMAGAGLMQVWRQQWVRYYKEQAKTSEALRSSEEKFRLAFDTSPDAVTISRLDDGVFVSVNKGFEHISGYNREEVIGKSALEIPIWKDPEDRKKLVEGLRTHGEIQNYEAVLRTRNREVTGLISAAIIPLDDKPHILSITHDISERKHAEDALRASEERYRAISGLISDYAYSFRLEPDGHTVYEWVTDGFFRVNGYTIEEVSQRGGTSTLVHPDDLAIAKKHIQTLLKNEADTCEFRIVNKDGSVHWLRNYARPIWDDASGKVIRIYGSTQDITEQKLAEEALKASELRFRALIEHGMDNISLIAPDGTLLWESPATTQMLGYAHDQFKGQNIFELIHPEDMERVQMQFAEILREQGKAAHDSFRLKRADGAWRWVEAVGTNLLHEPSVAAIVINYRDITERRQTEKALQESEERFHKAFRSSPVGMAITASDGSYLDANEAYSEIVGFSHEELTSLTSQQLNITTAEQLYEDVQQMQEKGLILNQEMLLRHKSGKIHTALVSMELIELNGTAYAISTAIDITERKLVEEKSRQQREQLQLLYEASQQLNHSLHLKEVYQSVCDFMSTIAENDGLFISAFDHETQLITCRAYWMEDKWLDVSSFPSIPLEKEGRGTQSMVIRSGQSLLVNDYQAILKTTQNVHYVDSETSEIVEEVPQGEDVTRSALIVPLKLNGMVSGVIQVESYRLNAYTEEQLKLLEALALHITSAEQNALLYAQVQAELNERKQSERLLSESEDKYRTLVQNMQVGVVVHKPDTSILLANPMASKLLGLTQDQMLGKTTIDPAWHFIREDGSRASLDEYPVQRALSSSEPISNLVLGIIRPDKDKPYWVQCDAYQAREADGILQQIVVTFLDITERKEAEQALQQSQLRYRALFEDSPIAIWEEDFSQLKKHIDSLKQDGVSDFRAYFASHPDEIMKCAMMFNILNVNSAALRMYRAPNKEELIQNTLPVLSAGEREHSHEDLIAIAEGRTSNGWDGGDETLNGEPIEISLTWSVVPGYEHDYSKVVVTTVDITERKKAEALIRQYTDELELRVEERTLELVRASRAKDEFLANMSHELRTPLNGILGFSETLLEGIRGPMNERQVQAVELIQSSGQHLLGLINDILDVSKIESGKFELQLETLVVNDICHSSLNFIKQMAIKKSISVEYSSNPASATLIADPKRLKQILVNLLNNAVKFTPEMGKVNLEVRADAEAGLMRFSITDTGIGITPENQQKLFKPFIQVDSSLSRQYDGTGLGLSLVKKLVEMHGGNVELTSEIGNGSCFAFTLPWKPTAEKLEEQPLPSAEKNAGNTAARSIDTHNKKILLADDNQANVTMVKDYLESRGYEIHIAMNGREAIEKAFEFLPDIILMDIQMPQISGIEATHRLRADPRFAAVPIIALTAFAMSGDRERCLEAGMNEYMSKPVKLKELSKMIERFLEHPLR